MTLDDLLRLGDEDFVLQAYRSLLGREADETGLATYLQQVRQGADKALLVAALASSREGREHGARLKGLGALLERHDAPRPSRLRRALVRLTLPFRPEPLEPVLRQQRMLENRLYRIETLLREQTAAMRAMEERLVRASTAGPQEPRQVAGPSTPQDPQPKRLVPPSAGRHYRSLVDALALRQRRRP